MLAAAVDWEMLPASPFRQVEMLKVGQQGFAAWRAEERDYFIRMARQHNPELTSAVLVAIHTGLRRGELAGLKRYHLDFDRKLIEVGAGYCFKTRKPVDRTKNLTRAFIPMNGPVFKELRTKMLLPPDAAIFGPDLLLHAARDLRRLCQKVSARPIRWHDLRHSFASCLVTAGVPIYTAQQLMRHKSASMTQHYAHLAPGYLAEAIEAIAPKSDCPDSAPIVSGRFAMP